MSNGTGATMQFGDEFEWLSKFGRAFQRDHAREA